MDNVKWIMDNNYPFYIVHYPLLFIVKYLQFLKYFHRPINFRRKIFDCFSRNIYLFAHFAVYFSAKNSFKICVTVSGSSC